VASEIIINGKSPGRTFEGLGALSAGASSRLLMEYPEPHRSRILDFLFKPNFGASWHHLKVEIGGDMNSTAGTEPSHARTREEFEHPEREYFERGYEWWLMSEAKKRNPDIYLDILQWGAPGWIGDRTRGDSDPARMSWEKIKQNNRLKFYTQDNADFVASFIQGAKKYHGLDIDFCGIWNETTYDIPWTKLLRHTLDARGLQRVRIIAADHTGANPWEPAKDMLADKDLAAAVHAIGAHYSGMPHKNAPATYDSTPEAKKTGKPLWSSEDGPWRGDWTGAAQLARMCNRNYIRGKMTKTIIWSLISSYYENLPIPNSGPMKANTPWSGHYEIQPATWVIAHTTQFTKPGWRYLDSACGMLADGAGSHVALAAPGRSGDYSIIIETMDAKSTQTLVLKPEVGLSQQPLHVWRSTSNQQFEQLGDLKPEQGRMSLTLDPGAIYSLTTTTGQSKGEPQPANRKAFPFPYRDDFESSVPGRHARYLSDQGGVFEVAKRADGKGQCLRQTVLRRAIDWNGHPNPEPYSVFGSLDWRDYEVACDVLVEQAGYASVFGRVANCPQTATPPLGACLRVHTAGRWEILHSNKVIASGSIDFQADRWHSLALQCQGSDLIARVDGREVGRASDPQPGCGMAGLGSGVHGAQFDNLVVRSVPGREPE
jgi:galactosylceramidase